MTDHTTHFDDCGCKSARLEGELALWHALDDVLTHETAPADEWLTRLTAARKARAANGEHPLDKAADQSVPLEEVERMVREAAQLGIEAHGGDFCDREAIAERVLRGGGK